MYGNNNDKSAWVGMAYGLVGVGLFSLTLPVTRVAVAELNPFFISVGRAAGAGLLGAALLLLTRQPFPKGTQMVKLAGVSLGVVFGFPFFSSVAMETVPASHGGVVLGLLPLATAVAGFVFGGERPGIAFWVTACAGSAVVCVFSLMKGGGSLQVGDIWLVASIVCAAVGYALGGLLARTMGGWQVICWALVIALPISLPPFVYATLTMNTSPSHKAWIAFGYLMVFSQFLGFFAWNKGLAIGGVARVGMTQLVQPFLTMAAAAFWFAEVVSLPEITAAVAVCAAVAFSKRLVIR